jgi:hypothetical protein
LVPPQPVANIMATIATAKSKYRFIGASKFSVSGEVLAVDKCTWWAKLAKGAKCCFFSPGKRAGLKAMGRLTLRGVSINHTESNTCGQWPKVTGPSPRIVENSSG